MTFKPYCYDINHKNLLKVCSWVLKGLSELMPVWCSMSLNESKINKTDQPHMTKWLSKENKKTKKKNYIRKKGLWLPYLILLELVKKKQRQKKIFRQNNKSKVSSVAFRNIWSISLCFMPSSCCQIVIFHWISMYANYHHDFNM